MPENEVTSDVDQVVDEAVDQVAEQAPAEDDRLSAIEAELANERQARAQLEQQYNETRQAAEFYRGLAYQQQMGQQPKEQGYSPDDVPDIKTVDQIVAQRTAVIEEAIQAERMARMEAEAKAMYPDWDQVAAVTVEMAKRSRKMAEAIMSSPDPIGLTYEIGRAELAKRQPNGNQSVANRIQKNATATKTLSSVSGQSGPVKKDWKTASDAEILARAQRIIQGG